MKSVGPDHNRGPRLHRFGGDGASMVDAARADFDSLVSSRDEAMILAWVTVLNCRLAPRMTPAEPCLADMLAAPQPLQRCVLFAMAEA